MKIYVDPYKTDFTSEFKRWAKSEPSDLLLKATIKEQQEVLKWLRSTHYLQLAHNVGLTRKKHTKQQVNNALKRGG